MSVEPKVAATSALWPCLRLRSVLGTGRQVPHVQSCNYRKNPRLLVEFGVGLDRQGDMSRSVLMYITDHKPPFSSTVTEAKRGCFCVIAKFCHVYNPVHLLCLCLPFATGVSLLTMR